MITTPSVAVLASILCWGWLCWGGVGKIWYWDVDPIKNHQFWPMCTLHITHVWVKNIAPTNVFYPVVSSMPSLNLLTCSSSCRTLLVFVIKLYSLPRIVHYQGMSRGCTGTPKEKKKSLIERKISEMTTQFTNRSNWWLVWRG